VIGIPRGVKNTKGPLKEDKVRLVSFKCFGKTIMESSYSIEHGRERGGKVQDGNRDEGEILKTRGTAA